MAARTLANGTSLNGSMARVEGERARWQAGMAETTSGPDAELLRLRTELEAHKQRLIAARREMAKLVTEARALLQADIVEARAAMAELERSHGEALAVIREAAAAEAERILAEARQRTGEVDGDGR